MHALSLCVCLSVNLIRAWLLPAHLSSQRAFSPTHSRRTAQTMELTVTLVRAYTLQSARSTRSALVLEQEFASNLFTCSRRPLTPQTCMPVACCFLQQIGYIYCDGCDYTKYTGFRCDTVAGGQSCENNGALSDFGACQQGSVCALNSAGYIYCDKCPAGA